MYPFIRNRNPHWSALSKGIFDNLEIYYYYYYYFFYLYVIFVRGLLCKIYFVFLYALDTTKINLIPIVYYNILKIAEAVCVRLFIVDANMYGKRK